MSEQILEISTQAATYGYGVATAIIVAIVIVTEYFARKRSRRNANK